MYVEDKFDALHAKFVTASKNRRMLRNLERNWSFIHEHADSRCKTFAEFDNAMNQKSERMSRIRKRLEILKAQTKRNDERWSK